MRSVPKASSLPDKRFADLQVQEYHFAWNSPADLGDVEARQTMCGGRHRTLRLVVQQLHHYPIEYDTVEVKFRQE